MNSCLLHDRTNCSACHGDGTIDLLVYHAQTNSLYIVLYCDVFRQAGASAESSTMGAGRVAGSRQVPPTMQPSRLLCLLLLSTTTQGVTHHLLRLPPNCLHSPVSLGRVDWHVSTRRHLTRPPNGRIQLLSTLVILHCSTFIESTTQMEERPASDCLAKRAGASIKRTLSTLSAMRCEPCT